ncbi:hypothetical protein [Bosea sp. (in: a-proteobacteria)]|uniref:hypothetical protein n=1 Tax=Bosea sp. (in: a-proteobacteria) TaxID=1871050 RepID=UPI00262C3CC3|nr:hypothetical protein [Bosea sp. (in: a-proteobacteria)]MCO5092530.1 hypothetical protein [Bosea sp. (in: a-proteobacteria)]
MFANRARTGLAALAFGGAVLAASLAAGSGEAHAFGGRYERSFERPAYGYGWRPAPPAVHGFWGQRRWHRYSDGFGMRPVPPRAGYGYGWR